MNSRLCRLTVAVAVAMSFGSGAADADRIKRRPLVGSEVERLALDQAMNDGDLRRGDIIVTATGFLQLRAVKEDGTYDFVPIRNPLSPTPRVPGNSR